MKNLERKVNIISLGDCKEFRENSVFEKISLDICQHNGDGASKNVTISDLKGTFARMGPDVMRFHLTWPSCLSILDAASKAGIVLIPDEKIIWREINKAIEAILKNTP